jgi:hypothetical protein
MRTIVYDPYNPNLSKTPGEFMERLRCKNSREKVKFNLNSIKTDKIFFSSSGKTVFAGGKAGCFRKRIWKYGSHLP